MKRDMDLVRDILLAIEKSGEEPRVWIKLDLPPHSNEEVSYHVQMLDEAGLIEAENVSSMGKGNYRWFPKRLTWHGHEFLDTIRDPTIWESTKEGARKVGGFSLDLLAALAKGYVKKKIEEHTGVELDL